jgi:hypothetical protein
MKQTTPESINEDVLEFCREVEFSSEPFYVDVEPSEDSEFQECFSNVENYIKKFGGRLQQGWTIWEIPRKYIEAEFHAIWMNEEGKYFDISPKPDREKKILFIKDDKVKSNNEPIGNIRKVLSDTAEYRALKIIGDHQFEVFKKYWDGSKMMVPAFELKNLEEFENKILFEEREKDRFLGKVKIRRNEPCPCGSGKKYKKCCLKLTVF